jgi:hypothetical protein
MATVEKAVNKLGRFNKSYVSVAETFFLTIFQAFIFLKYTQWHCILSYGNSTALY